MADDPEDKEAPVKALDEDDIALLKTYGLGPYATRIKGCEKDLQDVAKRVNEISGLKESDTGLAPPSRWDLVSDKQALQEEPPLQVSVHITSNPLISSTHGGSSSGRAAESTCLPSSQHSWQHSTVMSMPDIQTSDGHPPLSLRKKALLSFLAILLPSAKQNGPQSAGAWSSWLPDSCPIQVKGYFVYPRHNLCTMLQTVEETSCRLITSAWCHPRMLANLAARTCSWRKAVQVARCTKIINPGTDEAKYVINVKQIAKVSHRHQHRLCLKCITSSALFHAYLHDRIPAHEVRQLGSVQAAFARLGIWL